MSHNGSCSHDHDCGEHTCAGAWSLYKFIDMPKVRALNEKAQDSIKSVFKPWELRLDASSVVESSEDDELLVFIPFVNDVKIRSISIIGGSDGTSPAKMRAFTNREDIDFSLAQDLTPVQEWNLAENLNGHLEYLTRFSKFQGVGSLTLHFPLSFAREEIRIHYIGIRGEATNINREAVANVVYEAMPNPSDHKLPATLSASQVL
eukprot:TRINITY_DN3218_c0_g1_i2.p1 TRINITY_DN3218_c0_g1~~TRINITY_DN3218_c0_g1_i2.p1  ORF type:complete len:205 (+),score=33.20 TRINITY_DN3218_c0_g1_i2:163-777(+)